MLNARPLLIASVTSVALVLANVAPPILGLGSHAALAKNDKDDSGDRGNGNGNDDSGDRGNGNDKDNGNRDGDSRSANVEQTRGNSASAPGRNKSSETATAIAESSAKIAKTPGLDAQLASLHAANANLQAFVHASPNSKVGQIAAYAQATVAVETAAAAAAGAQAALDTATAAHAAAQTAYNASVAVLTGTYGYGDTSDAALEAELAALALVDTSMLDAMQLAAHEAEVAAVEAALDGSADLAAAQLAMNEATEALANAEAAVAESELAAEESLNTAANDNRTPVSAEAKAWVDAQLQAGGVLDYFRSLATPPPPMP